MHATLNLEGEITEFYQNFLMTKNVYQHFHKFLWGVIVSPLFKFLWYADFSKVFIHSVKSSGHSILLTQTKTNCLKRSCNLWAWLSKSFGFNSFDMLRFKKKPCRSVTMMCTFSSAWYNTITWMFVDFMDSFFDVDWNFLDFVLVLFKNHKTFWKIIWNQIFMTIQYYGWMRISWKYMIWHKVH